MMTTEPMGPPPAQRPIPWEFMTPLLFAPLLPMLRHVVK